MWETEGQNLDLGKFMRCYFPKGKMGNRNFSLEITLVWRRGFGSHHRFEEYTEKLYKKDLHDPDNHDGVITHVEPDILECEVKWALGSITMDKASGGDGNPVELFNVLKMMLWKCYTQYVSKFGKLSSVLRTGKDQLSFQSQRKAMPKNAQASAQLYSSHMLVK